ncbi:MAG: acyltransferase domain-containing protein, partial [Tistlia sp.]
MQAYLFPGQGSQRVGMGDGLFEAFPELTEAADAVLGYSIAELCLRDPERRLTRTQFTQPALYVVNALSHRRRLQETGAQPDFVAGHSLGEYNALECAGAV